MCVCIRLRDARARVWYVHTFSKASARGIIYYALKQANITQYLLLLVLVGNTGARVRE